MWVCSQDLCAALYSAYLRSIPMTTGCFLGSFSLKRKRGVKRHFLWEGFFLSPLSVIAAIPLRLPLSLVLSCLISPRSLVQSLHLHDLPPFFNSEPSLTAFCCFSRPLFRRSSISEDVNRPLGLDFRVRMRNLT